MQLSHIRVVALMVFCSSFYSLFSVTTPADTDSRSPEKIKVTRQRRRSQSCANLAEAFRECDEDLSPTNVVELGLNERESSAVKNGPVVFTLKGTALKSMIPPQLLWEEAVLEESQNDGGNSKADEILAQGEVDINKQDENFFDTLLHRVVREQRIGAIRYLLRIGASVLRENCEGCIPFECLGEYDNPIDSGGCIDIDKYVCEGDKDKDSAWRRYYEEQEIIGGLLKEAEKLQCPKKTPQEEWRLLVLNCSEEDGTNKKADAFYGTHTIKPCEPNRSGDSVLTEALARRNIGAVLYLLKRDVCDGVRYRNCNDLKAYLETFSRWDRKWVENAFISFWYGWPLKIKKGDAF